MSDDTRTVHARYGNVEIVRYDRASKWFVERDGKRTPVTIARAVAQALVGERDHDGEIFVGLPGGGAFDAAVARARDLSERYAR